MDYLFMAVVALSMAMLVMCVGMMCMGGIVIYEYMRAKAAKKGRISETSEDEIRKQKQWENLLAYNGQAQGVRLID